MKDAFLPSSKWIQYISDKIIDPDKYFVFNPWCQRIGHLVLEILIAASVASRDNKELILIPDYNPVNREIFNLDFNCNVHHKKKKIRIFFLKNLLILSRIMYRLYNGCVARLIKKIPLLSKFFPLFSFYPRIGIEKGKWWLHRLKGTEYYLDADLIISQNIQAELNANQLRRGNEIRKKIGLPEDAWFICLHVREPRYLSSMPHMDHRDSDIKNYIPAINYIVDNGGYVVRMGDPSMTSLPGFNNVIDYALSEYRSGLMDLYLSSKCKFFLGCDSGPMYLPILFNRPVCSVNFASIDIRLFFRAYDIIVPKHIFSVRDNRVLSFNERINSDLCNEDLPTDKYIFIENTPDEILQTVKDYFKLLETDDIQEWNINLQKDIKHIVRNKYVHLSLQDWVDDTKKEKWGGRQNCKGMVGKYYLEKCWEYSPYLEEVSTKYKKNLFQHGDHYNG